LCPIHVCSRHGFTPSIAACVPKLCRRTFGDTSYAVGQRIVVRHTEVTRMAELLDLLVAGLRQDLQRRKIDT
jgi:hypothetical protein